MYSYFHFTDQEPEKKITYSNPNRKSGFKLYPRGNKSFFFF